MHSCGKTIPGSTVVGQAGTLKKTVKVYIVRHYKVN